MKLATPTLAVSSVSINSISIQIGASTGASAYVVDVTESSTFASPVSYRFDSAGTKTLSGLPDDSTLFVRVKAVAPDYDDSDFVSISAATLPKPVLKLSSPTVSASTTKTAIALRVGEVPNATNYRVEVSANESFANPIVRNYSSVGTKTITNLEPNTTYWVRVFASAEGYETSEPASLVATTDRETLAAPTLDVLSVDARSVRLSVGAVPSATRYVLERSSSLDFSSAISVVLGAPGEVPFDNIAPQTELYFRVKATANGYKDSSWTSATAATTPDPLVVTTLIDSEETIGSLRRAIAEAKDGEVVSFDPSLRGGTIVLNGSQLVLDKAISIDATALWNESENAPGLSIDANGASRALYISDDASIAGLEIVGGATDEVGGAIYSRYANPVVTRCVIRDSSATNGGAIHVQYGAPSFVSCVVENNYASVDGGGVYVQGGEATFLDCQIRFNESAKYGGGIENRLGDVVFVNCAIYGNRTTNHGGGIYNREGTADFYNCTVTANQGHGIYVSYGTSRLYNTITAQNSDSGIDAASLEAVNSLIDVPPAFVVPPQFEGDRLLNPNELDLRLSQNSLAIDRGDSQYVSTDVDLSGAPRVRANWKESPTVDIGAYEYQETFEKTLETPSTVVTTNLDVVDDSDGLTSLREAILWANQGDVVTFDPSLKGSTIELQGSQLHVPKELTIDATPLWDAQTDAPGITIDAGRRSRAIYAIGDVSLKGLIVTGGESTKTGGGIYLDRATGTVERCRVVNNYDTFGAGICSSGGSPTIVDCEISGNEASYYGAGIYVGYGNASIVRCSIHDNKASLQGGGFFEREGETSLVDCVIFDNESKDGGGVYSQYGGWTMTNCAVYGNIASNNGGGVCSISGSVAIINSTIAGNSASNEGGGLFVHRISTSFSRIANSIIALNEASSSPDVRNRGTTGTGRLTANNVLSTYERWSNASDPDANNLLYDPDLSLFRDPSARDYRLVEDSQAVDKGNNSLIDLPTDLDGSERVVNSIVDLGAYEFKVVPLDVPTIAALSGTKTAIVVKLDAVEGAQKYVVEYATNSDFSNAASKTYSSPGSKTISGLPTGTWYYVRVKATATGRPDSPYTEVRTIYTGAAYAMPSFTFSTTKTAIVLNIKPGRIDASQGAPEKIVVEYSESPDFSNAKRRIINLPTDEGGIVKPCKPTISGLIFATQYYFRIKAIGSHGNDSAWNANSGKPIAAGQLAVPKFFTSKVGTEFFNVRCYNSAGASGFEVMWSTSSDFSEIQCAQGSASAGTVSITGLDPSAKYYYKVRAFGDGVSRVDSPWTVIVGSATTKSAPASSALLDSDSDFENYFEEDELGEFWDVLAKSVAK